MADPKVPTIVDVANILSNKYKDLLDHFGLKEGQCQIYQSSNRKTSGNSPSIVISIKPEVGKTVQELNNFNSDWFTIFDGFRIVLFEESWEEYKKHVTSLQGQSGG